MNAYRVWSTPTRTLSGLLLVRDRRDEFVLLGEGSWMAPSRSNPSRRHNVGAAGSSCPCNDSSLGGFYCAHRVGVLALEVASAECRGRPGSYEHDLRVGALLDLMVDLERPMPSWSFPRFRTLRYEQMRQEALQLVGVSERMRSVLADAALAKRDTAWMEPE